MVQRGIPVPDDADDDDDLFCDTMRLSSEQGRSLEIELDVHEIVKMYHAEEQDQVALLTSAAKNNEVKSN